ncbi:MAG TPA: c-type cytochrome domain-containing protein [Isosphaeraceae bacterium]|jgi:WD40 repeat protein
MPRSFPLCLLVLLAPLPAQADDPKPADAPAGAVSFMKDVAPILAQNCVACHNARKAESQYNLTTFAGLAKGGQQGADITLEPGDPDASYLVELIRPDGQPRMPLKLDPLPPEKIALIERWVKEGAKYDGSSPTEDWITLLHKITPVVIPERYPVAVPITAVAFTPENAAVVASGYHELTAWKVADGSLLRRISGQAERVYDVAYSPDGHWLATASGDPGQFGIAKLLKVEPDGSTGPARDLVESTDSVFAVAFSPDSKLVAAAGADRAIRIWEVDSGKLLATIEDHADWIFDLAFSPDGKQLASASRDKTSKVFDVAKKEALVTFPGHAETVYTVGFAPDGKSIATGGGDNQIRIWSPGDEGKQVRTLGGFGGPVFRLQYHPDGKTLVACGADKTVRVFDPNSGSAQRTLSGHADWVYSFALSPDGKTVASGSWDGEVRLWNLADGKPVRTIIAAPGFPPGGDAQAAAK